MTMYLQWTCININRKDVHARMISINGKDKKICIKNSTVLKKMNRNYVFS